MSTTHKLSRRAALALGVAAPVAAGLSMKAGPALAQADAGTPPNANKYSFKMGEFDVSTLLVGNRTVEDPHSIFGLNVSDDEFAQASAENFIPADKAQFFFTPTVVNTGSEVVLFDAGLSAAGTTAALANAGYSPEDIDTVVITHMHGDHIGGLTDDNGTPTFANANYVTGQAEFDHWDQLESEAFAGKVKPLAEKMTFLGDGGSVASGITAMAAFGHTPGHMIYMLESGGKQLVLTADMTNHYVWSLAYPDWEVRFDMDKAAAAATRRSVLGMLAADRVPFIGYHMPFPAIGYVATRDDGFRYVPHSYQKLLAS